MPALVEAAVAEVEVRAVVVHRRQQLRRAVARRRFPLAAEAVAELRALRQVALRLVQLRLVQLRAEVQVLPVADVDRRLRTPGR